MRLGYVFPFKMPKTAFLSSTRIIAQVYSQVTDVHFDVQKLSRLVSNGSKSGRKGFD